MDYEDMVNQDVERAEFEPVRYVPRTDFEAERIPWFRPHRVENVVGPRDTKVDHLDAGLVVEENIPWLDISMGDLGGCIV